MKVRASHVERKYTLFIGKESTGHCKDGTPLNALESAKEPSLTWCWPLFERTPCKTMIQPGHSVAIFLARTGKHTQHVIARAVVKTKSAGLLE